MPYLAIVESVKTADELTNLAENHVSLCSIYCQNVETVAIRLYRRTCFGDNNSKSEAAECKLDAGVEAGAAINY